MSIGIAAPRLRWHRAGLGSLALLAALAAGALIARSPDAGLLVLAAAFAVMLVVRADVTVLVPVASLGLVLGSSVVPGGPVWFPAKFALLAAVGATAVLRIAIPLREHLPVRGSFALGLLGLASFAAVSTTYSVAPEETLAHAISLAIVWAAVIAVPLGCRDGRDAETVLRRVGYVAAATVVIGLGAWEAGAIQGFNADARFYGILLNPNTLGYFVAPILPALVVLAAFQGGRAMRRRLIASVAIVGVGLMLSASRAGALSAVAGLAVGVLAAWRTGRARETWRILAVVVLGLGAVLVLLLGSGLRVRETRSPASEGFLSIGTGSLRTIAWSSGIRLIGQEPLLGIGFGATPVVFPEREDVPTGERLGRVHNSYLEAAIDLGWPGGALTLVLASSGLVAAWRASARPGRDQALAAALAAGIAGGMVEATFESGILAAGGLLAFHFWLCVSLAHALRQQQRAGATDHRRRADHVRGDGSEPASS